MVTLTTVISAGSFASLLENFKTGEPAESRRSAAKFHADYEGYGPRETAAEPILETPGTADPFPATPNSTIWQRSGSRF
jgi:hypothetical protein